MRSKSLLLATLVLVVVMAGCTSIGPQPTPVPPTKTPKPTFTPTPDWTPTPVVFATATPVAAEPTAEPTAPAEAEATAEPAAEAPTDEPPAAAPEIVRLTASQTVNARRGPGTNYPIIGRLSAGQAFPVTGKNARGDWYQFDLNGQPAWVIANLVSISGDPVAVQVAQNIPAVPTARPTARPQPQPTSPPAPPAPPPAPAAPQYDWALQSGSVIAAPQCGIVHFDGQVQYKNGTPQNGVCVYIDYYGPRTIKFSGGGGSGDGNWSFSPCGPGDCKGPFEIYVVECPGNVPGAGLTLEGGSPPPPKSDKFTATITDKCQQGQWTNIIFKNTRE